MSDPKGETYDVYAFPDDEGNISGNIYADDTWYNGRYTVAKVTATDTLGNTIEYSDDTGHRIRNTETFLLSGSKEDREAPILRSIDIKGTNLKPGDKGEIRFRLLDKSDIWEHSVSIYRTDSNDPFKTFTPETSDDGNYYCEFTVNDQWYNGEYDIRINTGDSLGNNDNIMTGLKLRVSGSAEDYHPPEVISAVVDKTEAVPGDVLEFTVEAKDASRIRYVQGELAYIDEDGFPEPAAFEDQLFIMSREDDGLYHFNVAIDDKWKNGEHVLLIHSSDEWGNEEFDMETDVTVSISDSLAHQEGPLIKTITFDRHEAQPGDTVKVTATAEDPAGIDFIKLRLYPDISPEEEYYYFNLGDDLDLFPDDDGTYTGYITITHSWKNATYFVATAEAQDNLGNISYDNVDFDTYEEDYFTVSGATGEESSLRITSVKFDKEKVRFGEEMTMTATVEGTGEVGVIEVDLVLDDEDFYSSVWSRKILLYPAGDGVVKGSFPVKRTDHYWNDGHRYGIMQAYLMDTVYSTKSYSDKTDLDAYEIEDMRNIETNTFTVDVFADPVINPADYTAVDAALENIPEDLRDYTDDSILILRQAVDAVDRNKTEREQPVVDNYAKSINLAIEALEFKPADYSQVDEAIKSIPADLSLYTDESVTALRRAENNVVRDKRINEQEVVNGYAGALKAAIEGLKLRPADYKAVDDITKTVPGDLTPYTEASLAALRESLGKAERGLLIDKQDQVDTFAKDIEAAIAGLELRPADYSAVDEVISKVPVDLTPYTDESVAVLRESLDKLERGLLIDKQDQVDTFAKDIEAAIAGLQKKETEKPEKKEDPVKQEDPVKEEMPVKEGVPVKKDTPVVKSTPAVTSMPVVTTQKPAPVTGDKNDTLLWSSAAVLSLAGIGAAAVIIRKRRHNK